MLLWAFLKNMFSVHTATCYCKAIRINLLPHMESNQVHLLSYFHFPDHRPDDENQSSHTSGSTFSPSSSAEHQIMTLCQVAWFLICILCAWRCQSTTIITQAHEYLTSRATMWCIKPKVQIDSRTGWFDGSTPSSDVFCVWDPTLPPTLLAGAVGLLNIITLSSSAVCSCINFILKTIQSFLSNRNTVTHHHFHLC